MTIAVIQARMTSTRLPGKVLLPLPFPDGEPLIGNLYRKLKGPAWIDDVIVAIPYGTQQDGLKKYLTGKNIKFIEGPENDVLERFAIATKSLDAKTVIRITADNPFIDFGMLQYSLKEHHQFGGDYTVTSHLPYGMNLEIMKGQSLIQLHSSPLINDHDREHVTPGFRRIPGMSMQTIPLLEEDLSKIRVTVDTPEDYMRAALLCGLQQSSKQEGDLEFIKTAYSKYPYLF